MCHLFRLEGSYAKNNVDIAKQILDKFVNSKCNNCNYMKDKSEEQNVVLW